MRGQGICGWPTPAGYSGNIDPLLIGRTPAACNLCCNQLGDGPILICSILIVYAGQTQTDFTAKSAAPVGIFHLVLESRSCPVSAASRTMPTMPQASARFAGTCHLNYIVYGPRGSGSHPQGYAVAQKNTESS